MESLLGLAWRVYSNREEEDRRKNSKMLVEALQETREIRSELPQRPLEKNRCVLCKKKGCWRNECPLTGRERKGDLNRMQAPVERY